MGSLRGAISLAVAVLQVVGCAAARPDQQAGPQVVSSRPLRPALPLRTQGRYVVDAAGKRFKLASVNWYGAEERDFAVAGLERADRRAIARRIRELGFNSVRLPFSLELVQYDPPVTREVLAANPDLFGKHALQVLDAVIDALAAEGLVVVLDNHVSRADWCCTVTDGQGLWYTADYPEPRWIALWQQLATRYRSQPAVVGADLRNEPRPVLDPSCTTCSTCPCATCTCRTPQWQDLADPTLDWSAAATRAGNAILSVNPDLLIVIEGPAWSSNFVGPYSNPIVLEVPHRVVYSPHDYAWFHGGLSSSAALNSELGTWWGFLIVQDKPWTAPVWVGEFGTCHTSEACVSATSGEGFWFEAFRRYLAEGDIDWAYWALNGTQANAPGRTLGAAETYGVLDAKWAEPALGSLVRALQPLQPATHGP